MSQPHLADIDDLPDDIADFDPVGDAIATQDFVLRVQAAILAMPEDYQNVAIALFRDGLNSTQAGDRLGISPATVRTRLRWLRGALMSQLATDEITNEEAGHDRP
jgi:DNA-directed RNA polymerase specialized sigma24 family protein